MEARKTQDAEVDPRWTSDLTPAPGELKIVQAFLNTSGPGRDDLTSPKVLAEWLEVWGLISPGTEFGGDDLKRAIEVRGALRFLVVANHGKAVRPETVEILDRAAMTAKMRVRFGADGQTRFERTEDGFDGALAFLCGSVAAAQLDETWPRLKICLVKTCHAVYFARDGRNKYCSRQCTNRRSTQVHRKRNLQKVRQSERLRDYKRSVLGP